MKMPENINADMFAPCGMNCLVCYKHCDSKKACPGCRHSDEKKPGHCRTCAIKNCAHHKGLDYCYDCEAFPCKKITRLEKSYQTRYGVSLIKNSLYAKENGLTAFMTEQKKHCACPACGGIISLHDRMCSECRKPV